MNSKKYPKKLAIIMDGNRRWALKKALPIISGHNYGAKNLNEIVSKCISLEISELTVFAFSTENWNRPVNEVNGILKLIEIFMKSEIANMNSQNIVLKLVGDLSNFSSKLTNIFKAAEELTKENSGLKLNVALNYGGRQDFISSVKSIFSEVKKCNKEIEDIDENIIRDNLISSSVSDIDLLIRTGGEKRISNFMFWQLAYSELFFTKTLWPDFTVNELEEIIEDYLDRDRRFGKLMSKTYN